MENAIYLLTIFIITPVGLTMGWENINKEPTSYHSGATPESPSWEPNEDDNTLPPTYAHELAE